ncbi:MAG: hypothetical protein A2Y02_02730 [Omnitrophica bacterium GWA2_52_12]|nr:MAG: hypothetical protein A2Y02_02730 [Omnitrophica bacterium GWA2_52_12]
MAKESKKELKHDDVLTTGQIAEFCHVDPRTVHRWIRQHLLLAHELPITKFNRIRVKDFLSFLKEQGLPVPCALQHVSKYRILIVDDDAAMLNAIRRILADFSSEDYEFEMAGDGFAAGRAVQKFQPDLMILDLKMAGMDGFEVCRQIRVDSDARAIKILAVSGAVSPGFAHADERQKILNLGADDFLEKPFTEQALKSRVLQLLFREDKTND